MAYFLSVGVDVFFFLSGHGMVRALEGRSRSAFYLRRLRRLMPWFVTLQIAYLLLVEAPTHPLPWIIAHGLLNISTLGFYFDPAHTAEWFLSTLLALYLFTPYLVRFLSRKTRTRLLLITLCCVGCYFLLSHLHLLATEHACALARIPAFCAGIAYAQLAQTIPPDSPLPNRSTTYALALFGICLAPLLFFRWQFLSYACLLPATLIALQWTSKWGERPWLAALGRQSLMLYCCNLLLCSLLAYYGATLSLPIRIALYSGITLTTILWAWRRERLL